MRVAHIELERLLNLLLYKADALKHLRTNERLRFRPDPTASLLPKQSGHPAAADRWLDPKSVQTAA